ncbi:MAG: DUF6807 family protein, partial [Flavobacteriaceae bacterium]|nr:DUF6807 family protein [Flavobacteriaceae bacterium]
LKALLDGVAIGGSEDAKGYGGFSARLKLPEAVSFHSVEGKVRPQNLPVMAGPWMNISGICNSQVVMMGEPENLSRYQGWILRSANSMQNMAFPGQTPLDIKKGDTISFRNQLLVHRNLSREKIMVHYLKFKEGDITENE